MTYEQDRAEHGERECTACKRWFPLNETFWPVWERHVATGRVRYYKHRCKLCQSEYGKKWHATRGQRSKEAADERALRRRPLPQWRAQNWIKGSGD